MNARAVPADEATVRAARESIAYLRGIGESDAFIGAIVGVKGSTVAAWRIGAQRPSRVSCAILHDRAEDARSAARVMRADERAVTLSLPLGLVLALNDRVHAERSSRGASPALTRDDVVHAVLLVALGEMRELETAPVEVEVRA